MEEQQTPELASASEAKANKEQHINLRVTTAEKEVIKAKAAKAGLKTGEYIRRAALGKKVVEKVPNDLRRQISAAGNNLNQLTRLANAGKLTGVSAEMLKELATRLLETLK